MASNKKIAQYYQSRKDRKRERRIAEGFDFGPGYKFLGDLSLDQLRNDPQFSEHHRLRVFANKGLKCAYCPTEGSKFVLAQDYSGGLHYDVYTADNQLMTVDHVLSRAKGGSEDLSNLVPCCVSCNSHKAQTVDMDGLKEYRASLVVG